MKSIAVHSRTIIGIFFGLVFSAVVVYAIPPGTPYGVGETLDPACAPGDSNCSVIILPAQTGNNGKYLSTNGTTTSWATVSGGSVLDAATSSANSETWFGTGAGQSLGSNVATTYIGRFAGNGATNAQLSVFLGTGAGFISQNAANSIFIGYNAGSADTVNNTVSGASILIGNTTLTGGFSNSIALGTGATNTATHQFLVAPEYTQFNMRGVNYTMPSALGSAGAVLTDAAGNGTLSWAVPSGGSGTPGGASGDIQFNNSGSFDGSSNLTWDTTNLALTGAQTITSSGAALSITSTATNAINVFGGGAGVALGTGLQTNGEMGLSESVGDTVIASYTTADVKFNGDPSYIYANRAFMINTSTKIGYLGDPVGIGIGIEAFEISNGTINCAIVVVSGAMSCTSDERLKTNITDLSSALDQLATIRTVNFNWKNNPTSNPQIGFLAQDLKKHYPTLVSTDSKGYLQVNYAGMTPILTKAIQELDIKVRAIETVDQNSSFAAGLSAWLANAGNRITRIFTGEICLTDTDGSSECLTKAELGKLKALLDAQ